MSDLRSNYQASHSENVVIGSETFFQQQTLFLGEGKIIIGSNVLVGYPFAPHFYGFHTLICAEFPDAVIEIGDGTSLSNDISIRSLGKIKIGKNCLIGDRVTIYDSDFHEITPETRRRSPGTIMPVIIEDNVWIGTGATILRGVIIGANSIVATGSVVTKDVPRNTIVGGNPARVIREL